MINCIASGCRRILGIGGCAYPRPADAGPTVESAYITAGHYDIMVEVWIDAKGGLIEFLSQTLAKVEGIASTESFLVMKSFNKWLPRADL